MDHVQSRPGALPPDWGAVLDQVRQALRQVAQAAEERERTAAATAWNQPKALSWQRLEDCLSALQRTGENARAGAAGTDALLLAAEDELRNWHRAVQALGQRLAEMATLQL